jgi:TRAP-type C4-dicarboxylate transport system permease small subunit
VVSRYLFQFSIFFINSAARLLLVWFFLLGAGLALRRASRARDVAG